MKKKPEFLALYIAYVTLFIGVNYILYKKASFATSILTNDDYFRVEGSNAIQYGIIFVIFSLISLFIFFYSLKKNKIILSSIKKKVIIFILLYLYIPIFNIIISISNLAIFIIQVVILFSIIVLVIKETWDLYKKASDGVNN